MTDYISREKFIATCVDVYCKNCDRRKNGKGKMVYDIGGTPCRSCDIMTVLNDIECFPAADVAPVVHAQWEKRMEQRKGNGYEAYTPVWKCSVCGKDYEPATALIVNYCYNCGAKMDGGTE